MARCKPAWASAAFACAAETCCRALSFNSAAWPATSPSFAVAAARAPSAFCSISSRCAAPRSCRSANFSRPASKTAVPALAAALRAMPMISRRSRLDMAEKSNMAAREVRRPLPRSPPGRVGSKTGSEVPVEISLHATRTVASAGEMGADALYGAATYVMLYRRKASRTGPLEPGNAALRCVNTHGSSALRSGCPMTTFSRASREETGAWYDHTCILDPFPCTNMLGGGLLCPTCSQGYLPRSDLRTGRSPSPCRL